MQPSSRGRLGSRNSQQRQIASSEFGDFNVGNSRSHARPDVPQVSGMAQTGFRDRGNHNNNAVGRPGAA